MKKCLLVGAGWMAQEHLKALNHLLETSNLCVYAPSDKKSQAIKELGHELRTGDLTPVIEEFQPDCAIIASPVDTLIDVTDTLAQAGVNDLLIEKPAFLYEKDFKRLEGSLKNKRAFVAFNRRFYPAVLKARKMIENQNEKLLAVQFEFTERESDVIGTDKFPKSVQNRWALANSSHVIDMAFIPSGLPDPDRSQFLKSGSLDWHPTAAQMVGTGFTNSEVQFNYSAYWGGVGRWSVEWITNKHRYIFRPMEKLFVQEKGQFSLEEIPLEAEPDNVKVGLFGQAKAFLSGDNESFLMPFSESFELFKIVCEMAGYEETQGAKV